MRCTGGGYRRGPMNNAAPAMNFTPNDLYTTRATSHAVASPCVAVCKMNPANDFCDGCLRTIDEIAAWSTLGNDGKRLIWQHIEQRKAALVALPAATQVVAEVPGASQKVIP